MRGAAKGVVINCVMAFFYTFLGFHLESPGLDHFSSKVVPDQNIFCSLVGLKYRCDNHNGMMNDMCQNSGATEVSYTLIPSNKCNIALDCMKLINMSIRMAAPLIRHVSYFLTGVGIANVAKISITARKWVSRDQHCIYNFLQHTHPSGLTYLSFYIDWSCWRCTFIKSLSIIIQSYNSLYPNDIALTVIEQ